MSEDREENQPTNVGPKAVKVLHEQRRGKFIGQPKEEGVKCALKRSERKKYKWALFYIFLATASKNAKKTITKYI